MQAEATDLITDPIKDGGRIAGVRAKTPDGALEIRSVLTIGADGRHSTVREQTGLQVMDLGAPMDVFWMRISRHVSDPGQSLGHIEPGKMFVMIDREDYWQCAFLIPKGAADEIRQRGIEQFREDVATLEPFLRDRVGELRDWNEVSLLTVKVDRLTQWFRPGLLCIGDAAHAMSPVGGVGINLAIQDAVAAANILASKLAAGNLRVGGPSRCAEAPRISDSRDADASGAAAKRSNPAGSLQALSHSRFRGHCGCCDDGRFCAAFPPA
jgi:2-polyprenyl-6-methoxyphenol hydroxylase-like FAD-dependent oxidoreductase